MDTIWRVNGGGSGVIVQSGIKENKYVKQHTYPSLGHYSIAMEDPNRNGGIINIPNSINVPFFIQSELRITNSNNHNNSAKPTAILYPDAQVGVPLVQNLAFYDPDADFLTFELTTPRGEDGQFAVGYSIPNGVSVNPLNGDFVWDSPQEQGEYNFAMVVNEYRAGQFVGSVTVDFQVTVLAYGFTGGFSEMGSWPTNSTSDFAITVEPNHSIDLGLVYADEESNDIQLEAFGEPFILGNTATFNSDSSGSNYQAKTFNWTPLSENMRCAPYIVSFRGTTLDGFSLAATDVSLLIYVHDQATQLNPDCFVFAGVEDSAERQGKRVNFYPNPMEANATISFGTGLPLDFQCELFDVAGKHIRSFSGSTDSVLGLNRNGLVSGTYIYKVSFSDGWSENGKIVMY